MLKMTVRPLAIKNSNIPNRTPLSVDMTISSSTSYPTVRLGSSPRPACGERSDGIEDAIRVMGIIRESESVESPPHPNPLRASFARLGPASGERKIAVHSQFGRSILQVVGSTVAGVSILATSFQPQPVFSSSNGSLSLRSPSEAMYIGWENW